MIFRLATTEPLFAGINVDLREGEALELRGRNGAGKSTFIKQLLESLRAKASETASRNDSSRVPTSDESLAADVSDALPSARSAAPITVFYGELTLDPQVRVGIYEQEVTPEYFELSLKEAIERTYLDRNLSISETKIRSAYE